MVGAQLQQFVLIYYASPPPPAPTAVSVLFGGTLNVQVQPLASFNWLWLRGESSSFQTAGLAAVAVGELGSGSAALPLFPSTFSGSLCGQAIESCGQTMFCRRYR